MADEFEFSEVHPQISWPIEEELLFTGSISPVTRTGGYFPTVKSEPIPTVSASASTEGEMFQMGDIPGFSFYMSGTTPPSACWQLEGGTPPLSLSGTVDNLTCGSTKLDLLGDYFNSGILGKATPEPDINSVPTMEFPTLSVPKKERSPTCPSNNFAYFGDLQVGEPSTTPMVAPERVKSARSRTPHGKIGRKFYLSFGKMHVLRGEEEIKRHSASVHSCFFSPELLLLKSSNQFFLPKYTSEGLLKHVGSLHKEQIIWKTSEGKEPVKFTREQITELIKAVGTEQALENKTGTSCAKKCLAQLPDVNPDDWEIVVICGCCSPRLFPSRGIGSHLIRKASKLNLSEEILKHYIYCCVKCLRKEENVNKTNQPQQQQQQQGICQNQCQIDQCQCPQDHDVSTPGGQMLQPPPDVDKRALYYIINYEWDEKNCGTKEALMDVNFKTGQIKKKKALKRKDFLQTSTSSQIEPFSGAVKTGLPEKKIKTS